MSALDKVLRAAADAIRALPDRELVALALHGSGPGAPPLAEAAAALPTAALRQEAATSDPRPTSGAQPSALSRRSVSVLEALRRSGPLTKAQIAESLSLSATTAHRALDELRGAGLASMDGGRPALWSLRP